MKKLTVTAKVHFGTGRRSKKELRPGVVPDATSPARVPRVARLMALAIRFEQLVRDGTVADYVELARLCHVTRARMTQIMNLLNLAPDIQEKLLFLPAVESGKDVVTERVLRRVTAEVGFAGQRQGLHAVLPARNI